MKRIVVNINFEFASMFKEHTGVDFVEAIKNYLMSKFGESNVEVTYNDEYNFEIDVNTGKAEIESGQLVDLILEELGLKQLNGQGFVISCINQAPAGNAGGLASLFNFGKIGGNKFSGEVKKIKALSEHLSSVVIGQEYAINTVVNGFIESLAFKQTNQTKPALTYFFAGPENTGKTLLARETVKCLNMPYLEFNSIDYTSDSFVRRLANFINKHPNGAIIFNDSEDFGAVAGIIYSAYVTGGWNNLSFRGLTIFFTTKCGRSLYKDSPKDNLSRLSARDIIDSCTRDVDELTQHPYFHPLLLKVLENVHIVMFNHLQTVNYQFIIAQHLTSYGKSFSEKTGVEVEMDYYELSRLVIFNNPNETSVTKLKKAAEDLFLKEVEYIIRQNNEKGESLLLSLEKISVGIDFESADEAVKELFKDRIYNVLVVCDDKEFAIIKKAKMENCIFIHAKTVKEVKDAVKGKVDLVLVDPLLGVRGDNLPVDIEDYISTGNEALEYLNRYNSRIPIFLISNKALDKQPGSYQTLMNKGIDELIYYSEEDGNQLGSAIMNAVTSFELDNDVESLIKNNLYLDYNPKEEINGKVAKVLLSKLVLRSASFVNFDDSNYEYRYIRSLDDVVGNKVCKEELRKYGQYLTATAEYIEEGKLPPRLILLHAYEGMGKTALVKGLAGETGATIINIDAKDVLINGIDYVDAIKEAFKKARYSAPAIVHFQNINVIFGAGENAMIVRALEALNAEMNYTSKDYLHPVLFIGECDYRYSVNDKLRDLATRSFVLPDPTIADVEELINKYLRDRNITTVTKKGARNFALRAYHTYRNVIRALDFAVNYAEGKPLTDHILKVSLDVFLVGDINVRNRDEHEVLTTSYHEIGHYLLYRLAGDHPPFVTVISRGDFGGYTLGEMSDDSKHLTKQYFLNQICMSFGGRAAEVILNGDEEGTTFGLYSDIMKATNTAKLMVSRIGMGKHLAAYDPNDLMFNSIASKEIYDEVNEILEEQYQRALRLLRLNGDSLKILSEALAKSGSMTGDELEALVPDDKLIKE